MKQLYLTNRDQWRNWFSGHHATEAEVWLIFYKKETSYRKQYIGWIAVAKRAETKKQRIEESLILLEKRKKLGMK